MRKVWDWLKRFGLWVIGIPVLVVSVGLWWWRRQQRQLGAVKDQLAVEKALTRIKELRALRESLGERLEEKDQAIQDIDEQLEHNMRAIVEAHEGGEGLSDEEMLAEFVRLGY